MSKDLQAIYQQNALLAQFVGALGVQQGLLDEAQAKALQRQFAVGQKHTTANNFQTADGAFNETAFFQDCALDTDISNATILPIGGVMNDLPSKGSIALNRKVAALVDVNTAATGDRPTAPCDDPETIGQGATFCKMNYNFGCRRLKTNTLEINELTAKACNRLYDDFVYFGRDQRALPIPFDESKINDRNYIQEGAVRKQLRDLTREHQIHALRTFWTGDPANNTAQFGYSEPLGLFNLIIDDYPTNAIVSPFLESSSGVLADCSPMNSDIKDFGGRCLGGVNNNPNIYAVIQELEDTIYTRAHAAGMLPATWKFVMMSIHWKELVKTFPCQMVGDGCLNVNLGGDGQANINVNDGGNGFFNMEVRQDMVRTRTITVNGRVYPVIIDDSIPYQFDAGTTSYQAPIFFLPYRMAGMDTLFIEYFDYTKTSQALAPLAGSLTNLLGWTDKGRYYYTFNFVGTCFEIISKICWRTIFKGSRYAGKIDRVVACPLQQKPLFFDPTGTIT